jgi:hypothetical protein
MLDPFAKCIVRPLTLSANPDDVGPNQRNENRELSGGEVFISWGCGQDKEQQPEGYLIDLSAFFRYVLYVLKSNEGIVFYGQA